MSFPIHFLFLYSLSIYPRMLLGPFFWHSPTVVFCLGHTACMQASFSLSQLHQVNQCKARGQGVLLAQIKVERGEEQNWKGKGKKRYVAHSLSCYMHCGIQHYISVFFPRTLLTNCRCTQGLYQSLRLTSQDRWDFFLYEFLSCYVCFLGIFSEQGKSTVVLCHCCTILFFLCCYLISTPAVLLEQYQAGQIQKKNKLLKQCGKEKEHWLLIQCIVLSFSTQIFLGFCNTWYGASSIKTADTCLLNDQIEEVEENLSIFLLKTSTKLPSCEQFLNFNVRQNQLEALLNEFSRSIPRGSPVFTGSQSYCDISGPVPTLGSS